MDIELPPDFREILRLLNVHKVEYLLIGGYAVGYHGYPRATHDLDIWIAIQPNNAKRVVAALREFGFDMPELSPINLHDLKINKQASGRHKDLDDLEHLP